MNESAMIDFNAYWSLIYYFLASHKLIAIGLGVSIAIFCYRKPVGAIKFFGVCALIVTALYIMSMLSESGSLGEVHKRGMSNKTESGLTD